VAEAERLLAELDGELPTAGKPLMKGDRLLTVHEVAERLGLSSSYAYKQAARWPFTRKLSARALRFSEAGLERWMAAKGGKAAIASPTCPTLPCLPQRQRRPGPARN
jgi:predicted DNA-binding transcriptional regulator AlpA